MVCLFFGPVVGPHPDPPRGSPVSGTKTPPRPSERNRAPSRAPVLVDHCPHNSTKNLTRSIRTK
ncbi:expressed unknown protein [Ectocarpus siliculosus]|uniref:Uncharacterized protein n=1 Tax=Ectocarpus siliculosus TaxID=2880 RepID=D8LIL0_ECTSI|nr:expressed unknown protein [Ectocarpus siliculosus]|eukprot:CBN80049.1 expressed unknown protein [Ectocarpus siliculosus]